MTGRRLSRNGYSIKPIGVIHSSYTSLRDTPYQSIWSGEHCKIEIFREFSRGLTDIEGFSHLLIFYWMHKSKSHSLLVQTPWDSVAHGLFATRSPNRPNPVGFSVVKFIERRENTLIVSGIDALEGTPVIDIKPYIPSLDSKKNCKIGWLKHKNTEYSVKETVMNSK